MSRPSSGRVGPKGKFRSPLQQGQRGFGAGQDSRQSLKDGRGESVAGVNNIAEAYIHFRTNLHLHLRGVSFGGCHLRDYCVVYERSENRHMVDISGVVADMYPVSGALRGRSGDRDGFVFVVIVKTEQKGQRIELWVPSSVRLQMLDDCLNAERQTPNLLLSTLTVGPLFPSLKDRKGGDAIPASPQGVEPEGQTPDCVVEGGSGVVNTVADKQPQVEGWLSDVDALELLSSFHIVFDGNAIEVRSKIGPNFRCKVVEVLLRPRKFGVGTFKEDANHG